MNNKTKNNEKQRNFNILPLIDFITDSYDPEYLANLIDEMQTEYSIYLIKNCNEISPDRSEHIWVLSELKKYIRQFYEIEHV